MEMEQRVFRNIDTKFRLQGISQKTDYNIQNTGENFISKIINFFPLYFSGLFFMFLYICTFFFLSHFPSFFVRVLFIAFVFITFLLPSFAFL